MEKKVIYPRPKLNPLPQKTEGVEEAIISLNGSDWKWNPEPGENFTELEWEDASWEETSIPSEKEAGEEEYAFIRLLDIPEDWRGKKIFLRFDGVNCLARVFVDGKKAGEHYGGFVSWDCEITGLVKAGGTHRLIVGVTDKPKDVSPFHRGGIIRDVMLYTLPCISLARFQAKTVLVNAYRDALLTVEAFIEGGAAQLTFELLPPEGRNTEDEGPQWLGSITAEDGCELTAQYDIAGPEKWDSEHPWLYTLVAEVIQDGRVLERVEKKIGFRQIEKCGNQVLVNGQVIKLRGINHHDTYPKTGRCITREQAEEDVRLFKEANINFIRTSHYPPRPDFLDFCDQYGIYVEDEIAVAFLGFSANLTQDDPAYRDSYLGQFAEMLERDKSHPSVIIWSLANESRWGINHGLMLKYARCEDPDRLTIFSYPMTQMEEDDVTDLWSVHYANWDSKLDDMTECFRRSFYDGAPIPVLHDECTHIPHNDWKGQKHDPAIREFWGETPKRFWKRIWETKGALGCAVWGGIDHVELHNGMPEGPEWGILDGWRRKKPEYWNLRKAYSPIVVEMEPRACKAGICLTVLNRFNHTNLSEVKVNWQSGTQEGWLYGPDVLPGKEGSLIIPAVFYPGEMLNLTFMDSFGFQVEEKSWMLGGEKIQLPRLSGEAPEVKEDGEFIVVSGLKFRLEFSRETGLITAGYESDRLVITGGPFLHLKGLDLEPWSLEKIEWRKGPECVQINIDGKYGPVGVHFTISIDAQGLMEVIYTVTDMPYPSPRKVAITSSIVSHQGGYDEVGVFFTVAKDLNRLTWKRKGLWDVYPDWHIGRLEGEAWKENPDGINLPACSPSWEWKQDEMDWTVFGKYEFGHHCTRDFSSMKAYIEKASLNNGDAVFTALSDGRDSVRMEQLFDEKHLFSDQDPDIVYHGNWFLQENRYHSFGGTETWSGNSGDWCSYTFNGTGIVWYSSLDRICGKANIYIDGRLEEQGLDLSCSRIGKDPRDYKKCYRYPVFSVSNLPEGKHTIKIEVTGEKGSNCCNSYVIIDAFLVLDGRENGDIRFIIDSEFNYPEISWADYCKPPVKVENGYTKKIYIRLGR